MNDWVNNREAGDLKPHRTHYDVIVMTFGWGIGYRCEMNLCNFDSVLCKVLHKRPITQPWVWHMGCCNLFKVWPIFLAFFHTVLHAVSQYLARELNILAIHQMITFYNELWFSEALCDVDRGDVCMCVCVCVMDCCLAVPSHIPATMLTVNFSLAGSVAFNSSGIVFTARGQPIILYRVFESRHTLLL